MIVKNIDARLTLGGDYEVILTVPRGEQRSALKLVGEFKSKPDKAWEAIISIARKKRSLNANAYFHVLVGKIAEAMGLSENEVKVNLVLEYGSVKRDENGDKVGIKLPASVNVNEIYKYAKWFDTRTENGKDFDCYIIYEQTHKLDTKQMARLIDGTVYEAQQLEIETKTPAEISRLKELWSNG